MTNDDKALVERLRETNWGPSVTDTLTRWDNARREAADRIEALSAENERLRDVLREVFEQWAGSEGFIPETAPEAYLLQLTKRMADIARAALAKRSGRIVFDD